jgi:hypothetical protein
VLEAVRAVEVPTTVAAGSVDPATRRDLEADPAAVGVWELVDLAPDIEAAIPRAPSLLTRIGWLVARHARLDSHLPEEMNR